MTDLEYKKNLLNLFFVDYARSNFFNMKLSPKELEQLYCLFTFLELKDMCKLTEKNTNTSRVIQNKLLGKLKSKYKKSIRAKRHSILYLTIYEGTIYLMSVSEKRSVLDFLNERYSKYISNDKKTFYRKEAFHHKMLPIGKSN